MDSGGSINQCHRLQHLGVILRPESSTAFTFSISERYATPPGILRRIFQSNFGWLIILLRIITLFGTKTFMLPGPYRRRPQTDVNHLARGPCHLDDITTLYRHIDHQYQDQKPRPQLYRQYRTQRRHHTH